MFVRNFSIYFLLLSLVYLGVELANLNAIRFFLKPVLLLSLSIYFFLQTKNKKNAFTKFLQTGLFFSLCGDFILLFAVSNELFFIAGLILFLLAHISYIFAFGVSIKNSPSPPSVLQVFFSTLPFAGISLGVFYILKNALGALLIPVIAYISVITCMGIVAALRYKKVSEKSFKLILAGAIFFMISDTVLAFNKFYTAFSFAGVLIMSTYILAQYLIVAGSLVQHSEIEKSI